MVKLSGRVPFLVCAMALLLLLPAGCNEDCAGRAQPSITGMTPGQVSIGQQNIMGKVTGANLTGVTSVSLGAGITVTSFSSGGTLELTVNFSVSAGAAPGPRDVTVATSHGSASAGLLQVSNNHAPVPSFTFTPHSGGVGAVVHFDASASTDSDGTIDEYQWSFGDYKTATGKIVTHEYTYAGNYQVTLTVIDSARSASSTTGMVEIYPNARPVANFTVTPTSGTTETTFHFDASKSRDSDGSIVRYYWIFGDAGRVYQADGVEVDHRYAKKGDYTVTLIVFDNSGAINSTGRTVTVTDPP